MLFVRVVSTAISFSIVEDSMDISKVVDRCTEPAAIVLLSRNRIRPDRDYSNKCGNSSTGGLNHGMDKKLASNDEQKTVFHHPSAYSFLRVSAFLRMGLLKFRACNNLSQPLLLTYCRFKKFT